MSQDFWSDFPRSSLVLSSQENSANVEVQQSDVMICILNFKMMGKDAGSWFGFQGHYYQWPSSDYVLSLGILFFMLYGLLVFMFEAPLKGQGLPDIWHSINFIIIITDKKNSISSYRISTRY